MDCVRPPNINCKKQIATKTHFSKRPQKSRKPLGVPIIQKWVIQLYEKSKQFFFLLDVCI